MSTQNTSRPFDRSSRGSASPLAPTNRSCVSGPDEGCATVSNDALLLVSRT